MKRVCDERLVKCDERLVADGDRGSVAQVQVLASVDGGLFHGHLKLVPTKPYHGLEAEAMTLNVENRTSSWRCFAKCQTLTETP